MNDEDYENEISVVSTTKKQKNWKRIEETNEQVREVANMMVLFGKNYADNEEYIIPPILRNTFNFTDEEISSLYDNIIKPILLTEFGDVFQKYLTEIPIQSHSKKKKKSKHGIGGQERVKLIRLERVKVIAKKDVESMKTINYNKLEKMKFNCTESILISVMLWCMHIINKYKYSGKFPKTRYDGAMSLARSLDQFKTIRGISPNLISDATKIYKMIIGSDSDKINITKLYKNYSYLVAESTYDIHNYFRRIYPYPEQIKLIERLCYSIIKQVPLLLFYQTPPASGKTTLSLAICSLISRLILIKKIPKISIIYACYNEIVRNDVMKMLNQVNTPFALGEKGNIIPHNSCFTNTTPDFDEFIDPDIEQVMLCCLENLKKCDRYPQIFICDLITAKHLVNYKVKNDGDDSCLLLLDEPTAGIENGMTEISETARLYAELLIYLPKYTCAISATMPDFEEVPDIVYNFYLEYDASEENLEIIKSTRLGISCLVEDKNGNVRAPHQIVDSIDELKNLIKAMESKPLLQKFYTPPILVQLCNDIPNLPKNFKIRKRFSSLADVTYENVRLACIDMLKYIVELGDEDVFQKIKSCKTKISDGFDRETMFTETAHQHLGNSLYIVDDEKINDITKIALDFVKDAPKIKKLFKQYRNEEKIYKKDCEKIEGNVKFSELEKGQLICKVPRSSLEWPSEFIVNSTEHLKKYAPSDKLFEPEELKLVKTDIINEIDSEVLETQFIDGYDQLLLASIGFYNPDSRELNRVNGIYTDTMINLADKNKISTIISTKKIVYGTNLPLNEIIIDDAGDTYTQNMLFQLIGRAGRPGKSKVAVVIFLNDKDMKKVFSPDSKNLEAVTLCEITKQIKQEI